MRGATRAIEHKAQEQQHFNPHSPCGERRESGKQYPFERLFQSTLPMRGATAEIRARFIAARISIHTPHAGSDDVGWF